MRRQLASPHLLRLLKYVDVQDDNINETVLSAANLNGSPMPGHFYGPEMMLWSQPPTSLTQHTAFNNNQQLAYANNPYLGLGYRQQPFEHTKDCPRSRYGSEME